MMTLREMLGRLAAWRRRDELERDLTAELDEHLALLARDFEQQGMTPADARAAARRQVGNLTSLREESRASWGFPWLDTLLRDVRYALRGLRRTPGFSLAVILTLGLGIGANAAMFNIVDHLMFRPFPYLREPGNLHRVYLQTTGPAGELTRSVFPYTQFRDLQRWTSAFSQHAAFTTATLGVGTGLATAERTVLGVSDDFFAFFDAQPVLGGFFLPGEDSIPVGSNVAVLAHGFWRTEYGARDVVGKTIQVGNVLYTVVGVAPPDFVGIAEAEAPAVFVPITAYAVNEGGGSRADYFLNYSWDWAEMIVRTKPGVSEDAAAADLRAAFARSYDASRAVHPLYREASVARPRALLGRLKTIGGPVRSLEARTLLWVSGVALVVLLVACANVANLLLARAFRRQREIAVRMALGMSRKRLVSQAVTESLVFAVLGAVAGLAIAQWGGLALRHFQVPGTASLNLLGDGRTFTVALAAATVAAVVAGLVPVLVASRVEVTKTIKEGGREGSSRGSLVRSVLLVTQAALCVILLVGAGLFTRSLTNVRDLRLGYDLDRLLVAEWSRRGTPMDSSDRVLLRRRMLEVALAHPTIAAAAWTSNPPFAQGTSTFPITVPGIDSISTLGRFTFQVVSGGYFEVSGTRIVRGRAFTGDDRAGHPPVAVVSAAMAERLWPGDDPLGRCIRVRVSRTATGTVDCTTVIGVAENAVHDPGADLPLRYYLLDDQVGFGLSTLLLRTRGEPTAASGTVRTALQAVMPGQSHVTVDVARDVFAAKRRSWLLGAAMFGAFGVLAVLVAAVGLYGVIAYNVEQRMHEIGVRMALGARPADVRRLVVTQGLRHSLVGIAIGGAAAVAASPWIQPLLFEQSAKDPSVYALVSIVLLAVAFVAGIVPAERATRADPNAALRAE